MDEKKPGKPTGFTMAMNDALREEARTYRAEHRLNQTEMGELLKIGQQSYGSFESGKTGLNYGSATLLAVLVGYMGVDELFRVHNVAHPGAAGAFNDVFPKRESIARRMIRNGDISEATYAAVRTDPQWNRDALITKPHSFWEGVLEAAETARKQAVIAEAPERKKRAVAPEPAPKSTRKRGAA